MLDQVYTFFNRPSSSVVVVRRPFWFGLVWIEILFNHQLSILQRRALRDILQVQQVLGHRDLRNTLIHIKLEKALFQNADDEFHVKVAQNLDEACRLLEVGFEYVTEIDGTRIFKKRK
jgi:hypothetical protein